MTRPGSLAAVRAAVVGGSLGGLTCALLLRDLGVDVEVFERSASPLVQRGAGIGLLPETARYLVERAGVHLDGISIATSHIRYLDRQAERIYEAAHQYPVQFVKHRVRGTARAARSRPVSPRARDERMD